MFIAKSTTKIITNSINPIHQNFNIIINNLITKLKHQYSQGIDSQIYNEFLNNQTNQLSQHQTPNFKFKQVIVPRNIPLASDIQQKLQSEWKGSKIVLNIDPSHLIGIKRLMAKNHLEQNVYKGISEPENFYTKVNPSAEISTIQLKFDDNQFIFSDPIAKQILSKQQFLTDEEENQVLLDAVSNIYQKQPERFANRLKNELNVPQSYQKLIELAMYNENPIYFCGFNQYAFRNYLTKIIKLDQLRNLFMLSLKFANSQSYKYKANPINSQSKQKLENRYHIYAKQLIYLNYYKLIKKVQNGEIIKKLSFIANQKSQSKEETEGNKGRRRKGTTQAPRQNLVLFAHSYTIQTLHEYTKIKNIENYVLETNTKISPQSQEIPFPPKKESIEIENDSHKIEKNAILEVMLGSLWNKPFTFNRFPYLSEDYTKLSDLDKESVKKIYQQHLSKYQLAKKVFYEKNINKFNDMSEQELKIARQSFEAARKDYERAREQLNEKFDNKSKDEKVVNQNEKQKIQYQESYQESYEQSTTQSHEETKEKDQPKSKMTKQMKKMMNQFQLQESQVQSIAPKQRIKRGRSRANKNSKPTSSETKEDNQK